MPNQPLTRGLNVLFCSDSLSSLSKSLINSSALATIGGLTESSNFDQETAMADNAKPEQTQEQDFLRDRQSLTLPLLSSHRSIPNSTSQVAIVGSHVCPIESLDYEYVSFVDRFSSLFFLFFFFEWDFFFHVNRRIFENEFFKQDWRSRGKIHIFQYVFMKWLTCFLIGLIVSLIGFCNNLAVENLAGVKFVFTSNMMLEQRLTAWLLLLLLLLLFLFFFSPFFNRIVISVLLFVSPEN